MLTVARRAYAAVRPLIFSLAWLPLQAYAQLPLPCVLGLTCPSPPTVRITSPASGATVSGTISVTADASSNVGVAGVQFKLDSANLGTEATAAPYSTLWNTTTASNGSHTLTAVARDTAGNQTTSSPVTVTVSNAPPPPTGVTRYEETDPSVSYTAGWTQGDTSRTWSGGTAAFSTTPGAQATFTFTGPSVSWIGGRASVTGIARISLDGVFMTEVDTYSMTEEIRVPMFAATGLANASHTLTIEVTGRQNAASTSPLVVVDAFDVTSSGTRHQETDPAIAYGTGWILSDRHKAYSEGASAETNTLGAQATFTFTGTGIGWVGARGPQTGKARVYLDRVLIEEVDTYAPTEGPQHTDFTATGLAPGTHTLTIEVSGRNPASTDMWILIDAFDVTP